MVSTVAVTVTVIGATLALTGGLVGFIAFPKFIQNQIEESMKLVDGSDAYKRWETLPLPITIKFYFFNVSNPDDVQKGAKPIVKEIGPYVYKYQRKVDITRKDEILSYYEIQHYEFDEKASAPLTEADEITIVNVPLMSILTMAEYMTGASFYQMALLDLAIPTIFNSPSSMFFKTTPKDFLFEGVYLMCNASGLMSNLICSMLEYYAPDMLPRLEDGRFRFSIYGHKNNTYGNYYSINSGVKDISHLGEIVAWKNSSTVDTWREGGTCSEITGTDGGIFPPSISKESVLSHFNADLCRTLRVSYSGSVEFSGKEAYRFLIEETLLASPSNNSENECFCLDRTKGIRGEDGCLLDGVIELWECQGIPVIVSLPHFYLANEVYRNGVEGLKPKESLHTIFLDLEPMTAAIVRASKKAQVNIFLRPIEGIHLTAELPTTLMPIFWVDESFEITDELADLLVTQLFDMLDILSTVKWSATICGTILFICGLIWVLRSIWDPSEFTKLSFEIPYEYADLLCTNLFDVLDLLSTVKWSATICGTILFICDLNSVLRSIRDPPEFTKLV